MLAYKYRRNFICESFVNLCALDSSAPLADNATLTTPPTSPRKLSAPSIMGMFVVHAVCVCALLVYSVTWRDKV